MGNSESQQLCANFSPEEISRLAKRYVQHCYPSIYSFRFRFKKLDTDGSGSISVEEFHNLPELKQNPLVQRVIGRRMTD